jgi:cation transport ATPase-like protein
MLKADALKFQAKLDRNLPRPGPLLSEPCLGKSVGFYARKVTQAGSTVRQPYTLRIMNPDPPKEASGCTGTPSSVPLEANAAASAAKPSTISATGDAALSLGPASESLVDLFARLRSSEDGLTSEEARERLAQYGPNQPEEIHHAQPFIEFLRFWTKPLVLILLGAGIISVVVGEFADGTIITAIVILSIVLNFFQTYRSQRAVNRLRELVAPTATVRRDGNWRELQARSCAGRHH